MEYKLIDETKASHPKVGAYRLKRAIIDYDAGLIRVCYEEGYEREETVTTTDELGKETTSTVKRFIPLGEAALRVTGDAFTALAADPTQVKAQAKLDAEIGVKEAVLKPIK